MKNFFRKLFGRPQKDESATAPLTPEQIQSIVSEQSPHFDLPQLVAGSGLSVGKQRELNEDSLLALTTTIASNAMNIPFGLYIIADGMGGHQYGEIASNAAVRVLGGYVLRKFHPYLFGLPASQIDDPLQDIMRAGIDEAQRYVQREAPGSGTTLTAALVLGRQVTVAHVGDSRLYVIYPDGRMEVVTRDHSLVHRLEELGQLTPEEAAIHPQRNVLYRALGQGDVLEADIFTIPFPQGGYLMLCSDGLWGVISEQDIHRAITEAPDLTRACQNLIAAANAAGGPDNISVILVQMVG